MALRNLYGTRGQGPSVDPSGVNQSTTILGLRLDNLSWDEVNAKPDWTGMSGVAGGFLEIAATMDLNNN